MKKSKFYLISLVFLTLLILGGCGLFNKAPDKSPEEVLKDGFKNLSALNSGSMQVVLNVSGSGVEQGKQQQIAMNVNMGGNFDSKDKQNPKGDFVLSGDVTYDNAKYDGQIDLKIIGKKLYFNLVKYPDLSKDNSQLAMLSLFANKWFFADMSQYGYGDVSILSFDESSLTPEQKEIKDEFGKTNFLKDLKYEGIEDVGNVSAYKYTGTFDKDNFYNFVLKASEINKSASTDENKANFKKALDSLNASPMEVFVSVDGEVFVGAKGFFDYSDPVQNASFNVKFDLKFTNINQPVAVETPKDAVDIMQAFGAQLGGMTPSLPNKSDLTDMEQKVPVDKDK